MCRRYGVMISRAQKLRVVEDYVMNRCKYFVPNGKIETFIRSVGCEFKRRVFLLSSANAVGKTSGVVNVLANIFWNTGNEFFDYERYRQWPYPKNIWYASEHTTLKETVRPEIEKWFPRGRYKMQTSSGYPLRLETDTGFVVDFKRYDQKAEKWESATLGCVVMDEPPRTEGQYDACLSRLRLGGIVLMPMTPLMKAAFVKDRIMENNPYAFVMKADMDDNSIDKGIRGILTRENIDFMASTMSEEEKQARLHGELMVYAGLVIKNFNRNIHVIGVDDIERLWLPHIHGRFEDWPKVMVIDPHDRRPDAIKWAALTPDNCWITYDEMPDTNFYDIKSRSDTVKDVWLNVRLKEQGITTKEWKALHRSGRPLSMYRRIMDKRKGAQNVSDAGMTLLDLYVMRAKEIGFPVTVNPSYDDGNRIDHQIIREAMDYELFTTYNKLTKFLS